ncbi:hypothetical protein Q1695_002081 [Nippostrongylus brasiliensis]|nr:hypothetical protein Q1695_002081 [Nippostrongylus brasiliensis]
MTRIEDVGYLGRSSEDRRHNNTPEADIEQISPASGSNRIVAGPPARLEQPVDDQPGDEKPEGHARETGLSAHSTKWN